MPREEMPHLVIWEPDGLTKDQIMRRLEGDSRKGCFRSADLPLAEIKRVLNEHLFTADDINTWDLSAIDPAVESLSELVREHQIKLGRESDLAFGEIEHGYKRRIAELEAENERLRKGG